MKSIWRRFFGSRLAQEQWNATFVQKAMSDDSDEISIIREVELSGLLECGVNLHDALTVEASSSLERPNKSYNHPEENLPSELIAVTIYQGNMVIKKIIISNNVYFGLASKTSNDRRRRDLQLAIELSEYLATEEQLLRCGIRITKKIKCETMIAGYRVPEGFIVEGILPTEEYLEAVKG